LVAIPVFVSDERGLDGRHGGGAAMLGQRRRVLLVVTTSRKLFRGVIDRGGC